MDRSKIKTQETKDLVITYPNGKASDFIITLRSMDSKEVKGVLKKWDRIASKSKKGKLDFDQKEEASIDLLEAAIVDWKGLEDNGIAVECSEEEKRKLLSDQETRFVREQIDETVGDVTGFLLMNEFYLKDI